MLYVLHFSPNGTTLTTLHNIVEGMGEEAEYIDLSIPENREKEYTFTPEDTVLYGTISAGMLFTLNREIFRRLHGNGAKFAGIVLYGGGYYGVALQQLKIRGDRQGFRVICVAAFIGQHAQSEVSGTGRPDEKDAAMQRKLGQILHLKEDPIAYGDIPVGWSSALMFNALICARTLMKGQDYELPFFMKTNRVDPDACVGCGTCERNCPVHAITMRDAAGGGRIPSFDSGTCIACYRCINRCPQHAVACDSGVMNGIVKKFGSKFRGDRREPTIIL